jgi:hypothetical protein
LPSQPYKRYTNQRERERERERERLFIVSRYEDAFYAFPKTWGEGERREGGRGDKSLTQTQF